MLETGSDSNGNSLSSYDSILNYEVEEDDIIDFRVQLEDY